MEKESKYVPSSEEVKKAEEMMTEEEKEMSEEEKQHINAGKESGFEKEDIIKTPETSEDVKNLITERNMLEEKIKQINRAIFYKAPKEIFENDFCLTFVNDGVHILYNGEKLPFAYRYYADDDYSSKKHIVDFFKKIGIKIDPDEDIKKVSNNTRYEVFDSGDLEEILSKHGWDHSGDIWIDMNKKN